MTTITDTGIVDAQVRTIVAKVREAKNLPGRDTLEENRDLLHAVMHDDEMVELLTDFENVKAIVVAFVDSVVWETDELLGQAPAA
jgi:hypothetical protein